MAMITDYHAQNKHHADFISFNLVQNTFPTLYGCVWMRVEVEGGCSVVAKRAPIYMIVIS